MPNNNILNKTIEELSTSLAKKEFSSLELTNAFLDNITKTQKKLNCFITITKELAIESAKNADLILSKNNNSSPLTGIPIAHKDIFCTKGIKTSCGSKMLDNFIAPYDATIVTKLKEQHTVLLGKTNMDEFAMGASNETSYFGPVANPWDVNKVAGGSSGGSAACVAARLSVAATGTDTGGSIRQPAAFCGVTGLKPTYGRISRYGMVAFASSLDQAGPIAKTAKDCALLLQHLAGFDPKDSTSTDLAVPNYIKTIDNNLAGLKIGCPKQFFDNTLDPKIAELINKAIEEYQKLGCTIKTIDLPTAKLAIPTYYIIAPAECSSNLARYDGVRFGYRCDSPTNLDDLYKRSRGIGFGKEVKRRILIGTYVLSAGYYDAYYLKAQKVRHLMANDFKAAFKDIDFILTPTAPEVAFGFGEKSTDPVKMYLSDLYVCGVNLAGLPAISIPTGFVNNLPVGMQLIGNYWQEALILNCAHKYQQVTDWHKKIPEIAI
jgi:aspartyl-tRNA(Asn)/glutamyl-tRNA(Gln) amidotransferase subunit A